MDYDVSTASPLPLEPIKIPKKRGRPKKDLSLALDRASSSSAGNSAPPTPAAFAREDPLLTAEMDAFGVPGTEDTLPLPPRDGASGSGAGGAGGPKRSIESALPAAPLGRAKRPKNVKFSPAKSGKALARRSMTTGGGGASKSSGYTDGDQLLPNNDYCDACNGKGHFLCCEGGCLRSFHFTCLEPPLELEDVPDESWYCKACRAAQESPPMPRRNFFEDLIHKIDCENPKAFVLPAEIKGFFKNVATGPAGDFIDSKEHRPPSKITGRAIGQEDRDGYRLKDKLGRTILCYKCGSSASLPQQRKIISCDFCDQHWHLDCLDPPMTGMPPPTRKWMCPVHSDHVLPKKRQPKQTTTVPVHDQRVRNNGDIVIAPQRGPPEAPREDFDEVTVNRVRYQVPEETVILDFWGRVHEGPKMRGLRSPQRKQLFKDFAAEQANGSRETSPYSMGSPLTSLGDLSDADPPEVATLGYSPYSKSRNLRAVPTIPQQLDTSALDDLALLAEGYYLNLVEEQEQAKTAPAVPTPAPNSTSTSAPPAPVATSALASTDVPMPDAVQPRPHHNETTEGEPVAAPARVTANGLVIKLPARNGGTKPAGVPATTASTYAESDGDSRDKGKGRAVDTGPPRAKGAELGPLSFPAWPKTVRKSLATPGLIRPAKVVPFVDPYATTSRSATPQDNSTRTPSVPPSALPSIPPFRGSASVASPATKPPVSQHKPPHNSFRQQGPKPAKGSATQQDLEVHSKDDLQALMRVRRLMSGEGAVDEATKAAMLGFIDGGAVVPKLVFIKPEKELQPWDLPWDEETGAAKGSASPSNF